MSSANLLFLILTFIGPVVSLSSSNWVVCWAGMELSFLGLIPLLFIGNKNISLSKESAMKYFCIQALGSGVLFYSGLFLFSGLFLNFSSVSLVLGSLIKIGIFPFHFWVPGVVSGLDWLPMFVMLTIQKIAPFAFFICLLSIISSTAYVFIGLLGGITSVVGSLIGNNQTDFRAMLGCSSVAHTGWMVLACLTSYFWGYFAIYCLSLLVLFVFLSMEYSSKEIGVGLISLSGLPPFLMFIGKWGVLKGSVGMGFPLWLISLFLVGAVISLSFYLKFSYCFLLNNMGLIWSGKSNNAYISFLVVNLLALMFFFIV